MSQNENSVIRLRNISKDYKSSNIITNALNDISISFRKQEFVSILGPSGCGKTTLLNILGGLDVSTSGELLINNINTKNYKSRDWDSYRNHRVGFVFQNFYLIPHLSVLKNVELSLTLSGIKGIKKKERTIKAKKALEKVGLIEEINKLPSQLSGGQMQRVAIARSIVNDPEIILADEPTGSLDTTTSKQVIEILKEISKERLVIMVTHNEELASTFSTRLIRLLDGKIISDSNPFDEKESSLNEENSKRTSMPFFTAILLSFKNLIAKYPRTLLTVLAGSIGIIAVGLVLAVNNGVTKYINDVQRVSLGNYPITVSSSVKSSATVSAYEGLTEFSNDNRITPIRGQSIYDHYNIIEDEFMTHLQNMDKNLYTLINYNTSINMNLLYDNGESVEKVYTSYFYEMTEDTDFLKDEYTILSGKIPTNANEIALVVDSYNCISATVLDYIGLYDENVVNYTFEDLLQTTYKVIFNDDYYNYYEEGDYFYPKSYSSYSDLYNNSDTSLKIVGVLRIKEDASYEIYSSGILYTKDLTDLIYNNAINSNIVKKQIEYGYTKDVRTGSPIVDSIGTGSTTKASYIYESRLISLSALKTVNRIYIYTDKFEDRLDVEEHIENYKNDSSFVKISYSDYMKRITNEFSTFVVVLTRVLIIFASISLVVSSIMIAVITYISVIERTREIGILRSIGARKKDIIRMFVAETMMVGFGAGIFGVIGTIVLKDPINNLVKNIIKEYASVTTGLSTFNVAQLEIIYVIILLVGSIAITVIAGFIPSLVASKRSPIKSLRTE